MDKELTPMERDALFAFCLRRKLVPERDEGYGAFLDGQLGCVSSDALAGIRCGIDAAQAAEAKPPFDIEHDNGSYILKPRDSNHRYGWGRVRVEDDVAEALYKFMCEKQRRSGMA